MNDKEINETNQNLDGFTEDQKKGIFALIEIKSDDNMNQVLNQVLKAIEDLQSDVDTKFEQVNSRFEQVNSKFLIMDTKMDLARAEIRTEIANSRNSGIIWTIATMASLLGLAIAIFRFH